MSDQNREPAYREALKAAQGDLDVISERMAELNARRECIETATAALNALLGQTGVNAEAAKPAAGSRQVLEMSAGNQQASRETGDPLQNQIRQALGMAATA